MEASITLGNDSGDSAYSSRDCYDFYEVFAPFHSWPYQI